MNKKLAQQIIEMKEIDQDLRLKARPGKDILNYLIYIIDVMHNYKIRKIIDKYGYPSKNLIGKRGIESFWLLIQHQDYDIELQEDCLMHCDFDKKCRAYLTDRVNVNKGKPQIYGTQFYPNKHGKFVPRSIKDKKNLAKRRKEFGLGPFRGYKKKLLEIHKKTNKL